NLEITAEILRIAEKGAKKTHIVYEANLNFAFLKHYLDNLEERGLITRNVESGNMVKTTQKGLLFLQRYGGLLNLVSE
ncbi:MAG: winged helix-turn-helix domain-containing protein, partial [Candidatus Bathyarchaeia archaeon]